VNFVIAALLAIFVRFPGGIFSMGSRRTPLWPWRAQSLSAHRKPRDGCFNLSANLPDGRRRILRALLATRFSYVNATFWAMSIGKVLAALAVIAALYF